MEKNDIKKLPVWAQKHIASLEQANAIIQRTLEEFCDDQTPSGISYAKSVPMSGGLRGQTCYVQSSRVRFSVGKRYLEIWIDNGGIVNITADRGLFFVPHSHNVLQILCEEQVEYAKPYSND